MKAIIDVREWQTTVDMKTGIPCEYNGELADKLKALAHEMPYPGDTGIEGIDWTFSGASKLLKLHDPNLLSLNFTHSYFAGLNRPLDSKSRSEGIKRILSGIDKFAEENSFKKIVVFTGDKTPHLGVVDMPETKGILQGTAWSNSMAGIFHSEKGDLEKARLAEHIDRIILREEIVSKSSNPFFKKHVPDILLVASKGWSFKGFASNNVSAYNIETQQPFLPVYSDIGMPEHIERVCPLIKQALGRGDRVLLAIVEGVGSEDLSENSYEFSMVQNTRDWYSYGGYSLYYTLATGKTFYEFDYPPVFDMNMDRPFPEPYPFSMSISQPCSDSIFRDENIRSLAVGSRSLATHTILNADISMECYIRSMNNMGVMIVVNEE